VAADKRASFKMTWNQKFVDLAWQYKFRIVNYPSALEDAGQIIGSSFDVRKITVKQYNEFLPAMEKLSKPRSRDDEDEEDDDVMAIVPWNDGLSSAFTRESRY
jgi:hypothetical protein